MTVSEASGRSSVLRSINELALEFGCACIYFEVVALWHRENCKVNTVKYVSSNLRNKSQEKITPTDSNGPKLIAKWQGHILRVKIH